MIEIINKENSLKTFLRKFVCLLLHRSFLFSCIPLYNIVLPYHYYLYNTTQRAARYPVQRPYKFMLLLYYLYKAV